VGTHQDLGRARFTPIKPAVKLWPFAEAAAAEYGRLAADLRCRGRIMQQIDIMVAAIAFSLGNCAVATADTDLSAIPSLAVANWRQEVPRP
jgi:tRNA(fMet)-specific endonuclease VapC